MSAEPRVWRNKVYESGTKYYRARLVNRDNDIQVQSDYTGLVSVRVWDKEDATTALYSNVAITIVSTVTNTLQPWEADSTGWNFEYGITSNAWTNAWEGGHTFRIEAQLKNVLEGVHTVLWESTVEPSLGA